MDEELVMRSVYLKLMEDSQLRQLAHELKVSKSDLIRSAVSLKLREWLGSENNDLVLEDIKAGRRGETSPTEHISPHPVNSSVKSKPAASKGTVPVPPKRKASRQAREDAVLG